jgi:hypothetical protein
MQGSAITLSHSSSHDPTVANLLREPVLCSLAHTIRRRIRVPRQRCSRRSTATRDRYPFRGAGLFEQATYCLVQHNAGQDVDVEALGEGFGVGQLEGPGADGDAGVGDYDVDVGDSGGLDG